ncbi:hypothetical protein L7F22_032007 [Adiantum nelumboides]|nr:hypothetical protein [Adiantum nelumboides]
MATSSQHVGCRSSRLFSSPLIITLFAFCGACAPALALPSHNCSSFPANISSFPPEQDNVTYPMSADDDEMLLRLFPQLSFDLLSSCSFNSSYTLTSSSHSQQTAPYVDFFILLSPPRLPPPPSEAYDSLASDTLAFVMEPCFTCVEDKSPSQSLLLPCNAIGMENPEHTALTSKEAETEPGLFRDELSLKYDASSGELHAVVAQYQHMQKISISFNLSTQSISNNLPHESIHLVVGYITDREANVSLTTIDYELTSPRPATVVSNTPFDHKPHHNKDKLVWIIVGTILGASLLVMGLTILVLFIKKRIRDRSFPPTIRSTPITTQVKASKHDPEASEVPMMRSFPLTPPHDNAFQVSGTASWLKHPIAPR